MAAHLWKGTLLALAAATVMAVPVWAQAGGDTGTPGADAGESRFEKGPYVDCPGCGRGGGYRGGRGYGGDAGFDSRPCYAGNLTDEQARQLKDERRAYMDATDNLRRELRQKRLDLRAELAKREPDAVRASTLQADISALRGRLDQQRLDHLLRVKKINPDFAGGCGRRGRNG